MRRARSRPSATSRASPSRARERVLAAATREALECTAFANPDGSVAVVVLNRSEHDLAFSLAIDGVAHTTDLPAHAIATYLRR
jgi:glucosylceramidase